MKRITFNLDNTIQVFRLGKTKNAKISDGKDQILESYIYSLDQFIAVQNAMVDGSKVGLKNFFSMDAKNCFDCPFSANSGNGGCYTHKGQQYMGMISMVKSVIREFNGHVDNIPAYSVEILAELVKMATGRYVRFGSYGEPSLHPLQLVEKLAEASKSWTGYTHQYFRKPEYADFFMASVHNAKQATTAAKKFNYRSFIAAKDNDNSFVHCPASKEAGFKSNCSDCGLCSGNLGKGKKSIMILEH